VNKFSFKEKVWGVPGGRKKGHSNKKQSQQCWDVKGERSEKARTQTPSVEHSETKKGKREKMI